MVENTEIQKERERALELLKKGSMTGQELQDLGVSMAVMTGLVVDHEVRFEGDRNGELSEIAFSLPSIPFGEKAHRMTPLKDGVGYPSASIPTWVVTSYRRRVSPHP